MSGRGNEGRSGAEAGISEIQMLFTQRQLVELAKAHMTWLYGKPGQGNDCDRWMERFGLLCMFIDDLFSGESKKGRNDQ